MNRIIEGAPDPSAVIEDIKWALENVGVAPEDIQDRNGVVEPEDGDTSSEGEGESHNGLLPNAFAKQ
jgi:hypothetical protein